MTDRYRYRVYIPNIGYVYPYDERERALNVDIDNLHCDEVFASYEEIISDTNCQHPLDHGKSKRVPEKHLFLLY